jgi:hypothetical protein
MFLLASLGRTFWLTALAAGASVAVAGTAFTASLTPPTSNVASGATVIGGYTVSTLSYTLNGTTPTDIDAITFVVSNAGGPATPTTARAKGDDSGVWYTCDITGSGPWNVDCDTTVGTQLTVPNADNLTLVVSQ